MDSDRDYLLVEVEQSDQGLLILLAFFKKLFIDNLDVSILEIPTLNVNPCSDE